MIPGTHRGYRCALRPEGRRRARATQGVCEGGRNYPRRGVRNHAPLGACLNTLSSSIFHAERCVVKLSEKGREWHRELFFNEESKRAHVKKERNPVKKWPELPQPAGRGDPVLYCVCSLLLLVCCRPSASHSGCEWRTSRRCFTLMHGETRLLCCPSRRKWTLRAFRGGS